MDQSLVRILLVEDNAGDARLLRETLRDAEGLSFDLVHVDRLDDAVKRLENDVFDVLLLDLSLPDSQGIDSIKRITTALPHIPVVVLTGTDDEAVGTESVRCGAQDYLVKGQADHRLVTRSIRYAIERKRSENVLRFLVQCGAAPGEDFFKELARYLARSLGMDYVCIDRLHEGSLTAQTLAIYYNGKYEDNVSYALKDTPCGDVVGKTICCFPKGVRHLFAKDVVLQEMLAESYVGTTLWNSQGQPIGLIAIIGRRPLEDTNAATSILQLVAVRAAGEMERRHAEEALAAAKVSAERSKESAEAASKAKDHFLAVLSHELRNPLNPVLAAASMLRKDPRFDADTREQLEVICRNAELEARLIDDLLDVTRIERGKVELDRRPTELCTIIRRAAEVCMPEIHAAVLDFRMDLESVPCWVDGDAARLQQVFWNLIRNAVKFTPSGGYVQVDCRCEDDGCVIARVRDSGRGIEPDVLGVIFNAFEQADRSITRQFGGLGLGLTISKALVDMHGGSIHAHSEGKGTGATFTVRLPLLSIQAAVGTHPPSPVTPPVTAAKRPLRILLVEDHGDTARIMRMLLKADGHDVQTAADIATALSLADTHVFDLLLSDLGLPDGSGLSLMRSLRAKGCNLPGIALSGYGQDSDLKQSREAGFVAHLTKPVSIPRLEEAIAMAIAGAGRTAETREVAGPTPGQR